MKRVLWIILWLCLILALAAGGCRYLYSRGSDRQSPTGSGPSRQEQPGVVQPGSGAAMQPAPGASQPVIQPYPIKGISNRLSQKEVLSMNKWRDDMIKVAMQYPGQVFLNGPPDQQAVCLTFDDGPDGVFTPKVLDILKQYGVHGSFFCVGNNVLKFPEVVRRADQEGNLVLNHSWDHGDLSRLADAGIGNEIGLAGNEIAKVIGKRPEIVRPPYGAINDRVIRNLSWGNYKIVIWSIDTLDWSQKERENIARNVLDNVRPGDIILMHCNDDRQATVDALPEIITGLQARGYRFLTLSQMLGVPAYQ